MINKTWGERLRQLFGEIPNPSWTSLDDVPLRPRETRSTVPRLVIGDLPCGSDARRRRRYDRQRAAAIAALSARRTRMAAAASWRP